MKEKKPSNRSGGIDIRDSHVTVGGDVVGRDKIVTTGMAPEQVAQLARQFSKIYAAIAARGESDDVDKSEIQETVKKIELEVQKGSEANPKKVGRWLRILAETADDILQVTVSALASPITGIATAVRLIAEKIKKETR